MQNFALLLSITLALIFMPAIGAAQVTHTVDQVGTSFSPANLNIEVGDTVRWVWSGGSHTVTNGTGATDPNVATLFDSPLTSAAPQFEFLFTQAGTVPYFCRPHEGLNMKGTIVVEDVSTATPPGAVAALRVHGLSPNPFNPRTTISFTLGQTSAVSISIHDQRGRLVRDLVSGEQMEDGDRRVVWDGLDDLGTQSASGVYLFRVSALGLQQTVRGVLVR